MASSYYRVCFCVCIGLAHIGCSQHVLRVNECPEKTHKLDGPSQLWVRVTNHLLDHNIYQQHIL